MRAASRTTADKRFTRWVPLLEKLEQRETPAVTAGLSQTASWTDIGPNVTTASQVRNIGANNAGIGAVQAMAFDPTNVNTLFAAAPNGGIWRTVNANAATPVWTPISDQVASMTIADIAIDPDNPDRLVAAVGATADGWQLEGGQANRVRGDLVGLLYTTNARATTPTWQFLSNNLAGKNVLNVYIRGGYILAATDQGMFRSGNNGLTFTNSYPVTLDNGISYTTTTLSQGVYDLAENPRLRDQFYVATRPGGAFATNEVFRTDDGGLTWGRVTDTFQMQFNARTVNVQLTVRDTGAFDNQVYVAVTNNNPLPTVPVNTYVAGPEQSTPSVGFQYGWENRAGVLTSITWSTNQGGNWTRMDAPRQLTDPDPLDYGQRDPDGRANGTAVKNVGGGADVNNGIVTIITRFPHRLRNGDRVFVRGLFQWEPPTPPTPNPEFGGYFRVTVTGATTFTLDDLNIGNVPGLDSTRGYWQRVVDATAGERGEFLQIAASNLLAQQDVMIGADFSQFKFEDFSDNIAGSGTEPFVVPNGIDPNIPSYPGLNAYYPGLDNNSNPISFTGSVWRGNRFSNPTGFGASPGNSAQWATLTDGGTPGLTAPGGDTREMLVASDGGGNTMLWVSTGTGIYRRALNTNSDWTSANGNLSVGQFWSAAYDSLNNVVAGATQDTGAVESGASSNIYAGITSTASRNALTDQEYSYSSAVDNTSTPGRAIRFYSNSDFARVRRREFNAANTLVAGGDTFLNFAHPSTPAAALSGISIPNRGDLALAQDPSAKIAIQLNRFDARRGVYGLVGLYEDSDPLGGSPVTGAIVNDVTPLGMTGRVTALDYGGRRAGVNFNQILYVGTTTGQLWLRGEFGVTFSNIAPVPGGGPVTDVEMDPDDWRRAFVVQGGRIYETRNAGVTWTDVSVGLVTPPDPATGLPAAGGITTQIRSIALFDPNPGTPHIGVTGDVVLLSAGRGGVFRRTLSVCNTTAVWSEYGSNLPNTVVMELEFDSTGNRLIAGTFGRGVWTVDDVRPTLTQTLFLDIIGDNANNAITVSSDPLDPNAVIVSDGGALNQRFTFGQFDQIRVFGLGGADTVTFVGSGTSNGLRFINYPVTVSMGGDVGDQLVLQAGSATAPIRATVTSTTVGATAGDNLFSGCGSLTYSGLNAGRLTLVTGSGNDVLTLANGTLPPTIDLDGGGGTDVYNMNSASTANVFVFGNPGGGDAIQVTVPAGQTLYVDAQTRGLVAGGLIVRPTQDVTNLLLDAQGAGANLNWIGTAAADGVTLSQDAGFPSGWSQLAWTNFFVRFTRMNFVTTHLGGGADVLSVDSNGAAPGGTTQFVNYALTANMGGDTNDTILVENSSSTAAIRAGINGIIVGSNIGSDTMFGGSGFLFYTGMAAGVMSLNTGSGNDLLAFEASNNLFAVVNTGAGTDQVWSVGTAGNDVTTAVGTALMTNSMRVALAQNTELFYVIGGGGTDVLNTFGTAASNALTLTQTGTTSGTLGGIPVATAFAGVQSVNVEGAGGTDTFAWVDGSNASWGTPVNPSTGLVFAPTGPTSGAFTLGGGTTTRFSNVAGSVSANGDPSSTNTRDVISVLGASSSALGSQFGEVTFGDGRDTIAATDTGVSISNFAAGPLKPISFGFTTGGFNSFSTVYVRGGNETGGGDTFTATTTTRTNLLLDGGNPTSPPGDTLTITSNGPAANTQVNNPLLGPPHTRVTSRVDQSAAGHLNFESVSVVTIDPINPGGPPVPSFGSNKSDLFAAGTDVGGNSEVRAYNLDGTLRFVLNPFPGFTGGVRVAVGDVTGDGRSDVVVAAGPGGGPAVRVYNGVTGAEVRSFFAFDPRFNGGVSVAVGFFDSDRFADIVVGAGPGGGPNVKRFDGATGAEVQSFFAYSPNFTGGVNVAAGDINGDGLAEYITGTATGNPHVRVMNGQTTEELYGIFAFDAASSNGVNVAAADITGDGIADLITGAGPGGTTTVRVYDGVTTALIRDFVVNDPTIPGQPPIPVTSGVRVAAADFDGDGLAELVTGRGRGSRPFAQVIKVSTNSGGVVLPSLTTLLAVNTFGDNYSNGIFVGA